MPEREVLERDDLTELWVNLRDDGCWLTGHDPDFELRLTPPEAERLRDALDAALKTRRPPGP